MKVAFSHGPGRRVRFPSGPTMTPARMVREINRAVRGERFERVTIGYPGLVPARNDHSRALSSREGMGRLRFLTGAAPPDANPQRRRDAGAGIVSRREHALSRARLGPRVGDDRGRGPSADGARALAVPQGEDVRGVRGGRRPPSRRKEAVAEGGVRRDRHARDGPRAGLCGRGRRQCPPVAEAPPGAHRGDNRNAFLGGIRAWQTPSGRSASPEAEPVGPRPKSSSGRARSRS